MSDLILQFITAFDKVVISRYNKDRVVKDKIAVRYIYSPKQRAIHDLIDKAQTLTLPAIAVWITGMQRDNSRVFNKILGTFSPTVDEGKVSLYSDWLPPAVPVNVSINMSIITKYQSDMDQIVSNFAAYTNPYIVISWKTPPTLNIAPVQEIRTEVLWSESINFDYPIELTENQNTRFIADTSFTIKGWLFPYKDPNDKGANILYIDTSFTPVTGVEGL